MDAPLNFRAGDIVEIRSEEEILRTLDSRGTLDSLPFMPEMLEFCGKRFRVYKRAGKACDTIDWGTLRTMENAVHLVGLRCTGQAHGACQAGCLLYWKEAWLKPVSDDGGRSAQPSRVGRVDSTNADDRTCTRETLAKAAKNEADSHDVLYSCQATELMQATTAAIRWWELGQYVRDVRSRNASAGRVFRSLIVGFFNKLQHANARVLPRLTVIHDGKTYPFILGTLAGETPSDRLNLRPGELVQVKSKDEIFKTLDRRDRTRGLRFDGEMLKYCGRRGRVMRRVERIIDEKTGKMLSIDSDCIIIDGFICTGDYHRLCPRSVYPYWREDWLVRVGEPVSA